MQIKEFGISVFQKNRYLKPALFFLAVSFLAYFNSLNNRFMLDDNVIFSACGLNFKKFTRAFWFWLRNAFNNSSVVHFQRTFA
jgi:hypothetical protein